MDDTLAALLEREHHEIDAGIEAFASAPGAGSTELLTRSMDALRRHIYLEERFLFPRLAEAGLIAPVFVMVREHGQMWRLMDELQPRLSDGGDAVLTGCGELVAQLQAHNPKEEQILYPQADTALREDAATQLRTFIQAGHLPDGWVCEGASRA
ncbi:MAG: hemerythrin domain-containing protein [Jatrophihabitantaceae bacterium]